MLGKNFSGQKINFFSCQDVPARNIVNFFLAMARNLHFWHEIGTI